MGYAVQVHCSAYIIMHKVQVCCGYLNGDVTHII